MKRVALSVALLVAAMGNAYAETLKTIAAGGADAFYTGPIAEGIVKTVRDFVETELYPLEDEVERLGYVPPEMGQEIARKTKELGFFGCNMPEDAGGAGLDHRVSERGLDRRRAAQRRLGRRTRGDGGESAGWSGADRP